jgi:phospholipid/cholesterol/gamma-HCH transport system substrate-binding protein
VIHSDDLFSTLKNLSILVSALHDSSDVLSQLNRNLASVTHLVANDPNEVSDAVAELSGLAGDLTSFVNENRESLGITADKLASVSQALNDSIPVIKDDLHVAPGTLQNFINIYHGRRAL